MLEIAISPLLQVVYDRLASPVIGKLQDLYGLKQNFEKLQQSLPMIQAFLEDAEERQETDKAMKIWLSKLKDVAYNSEDLLDELAAEVILCDRFNNIGDQVRSLFTSFEPSRRLFDIAHELQKMLVVLDETIGEGLNLNLKRRVSDRHPESSARSRETYSFGIESEVYGRREDKEKIIELLLPNCNRENRGDVSIIPIIGIGGLGKTTLAQYVYNDADLMGYFDLKIWVHVSDDYDVKKLITTIIESATRKKCEFTNMDVLQCLLRESLCQKRYLLVLDDVWNEDQVEWDRFGTLLRGGAEGSKIIVTTRSAKVASLVGTISSYHLKGLTEDDCWALIKERAFGQGEEEDPNLTQVGKQIARKCGGVPLAAKTLGSSLRFRREESDWLFMKDSELFLMHHSQSGILPTLWLSYTSHLKRCFAYGLKLPNHP